jgi:quinol-cytochrome oxidoreductase complex cytochrome b subunit
MNTTRRLTLVALGTLATGLAYLTAPLWALASQGLPGIDGPASPGKTTTTIETHGSPLWQFGAVAVAVAVVAFLVTAAVLVAYNHVHVRPFKTA